MRAKKAVISPGRALAGRTIPGNPRRACQRGPCGSPYIPCAFTCNLLKDSLYQACELGLEYDHESDKHHQNQNDLHHANPFLSFIKCIR